MDFEALKEQHGDDAVKEAFMLGVIQGLKQAQEWRPIETAPKDEKIKILVLLKSGSVIQAEYWDAWRPAYFSDSELDPTHWMLQPPGRDNT